MNYYIPRNFKKWVTYENINIKMRWLYSLGLLAIEFILIQ